MSEPLGIALIGCGTVGTGVARLLLEQAPRLSLRAGRPLHLHRVVVRDLTRDRGITLPTSSLTTRLEDVVDDPNIHIAVELVGGVDFARSVVVKLLESGKDVVTANKALLAEHGGEIFEVARSNGRAVAFEASVAGGIPIISALTQGLAANQVTSLQGILNGTCNFILTGMTESGRSYDEALAEAKVLGYAEADPTLDVDGTDTAHKLSILAQIAFGIWVAPEGIARRGITEVDPLDIRFAGELGYNIKLLAEAWLFPPIAPGGTPAVGELALHVSPVLLRKLSPLAQVRGAYNAVHVVGDAVGDTMYFGKGAGQMPTASAVVADLLDLAVGRGRVAFQTYRLFRDSVSAHLDRGRSRHPRLRLTEEVRSRFYLRLLVEDRPGVLAEIAHVLAAHRVSIASVIQHEVPDEQEGEKVQLVIMIHAAPTGAFTAACDQISRLDCVTPPPVYYPVSD